MTPTEINLELLRAFGIAPEGVKRVTIDVLPGRLPTITVVRDVAATNADRVSTAVQCLELAPRATSTADAQSGGIGGPAAPWHGAEVMNFVGVPEERTAIGDGVYCYTAEVDLANLPAWPSMTEAHDKGQGVGPTGGYSAAMHVTLAEMPTKRPAELAEAMNALAAEAAKLTSRHYR